MKQMVSMMDWVVVTGGGSGIGRALVNHFSKNNMVLTCRRRLAPLQETQACATKPNNIKVMTANIGDAADRAIFVSALPGDARLRLLVQNSAIGDPARFEELDLQHLEESVRVNVLAPLALSQSFLPALKRAASHNGDARILHLGTSVAHNPQEGTLVYGVTKMAFNRLYQQLNSEPALRENGVVCGSLSPGMVPTEGVLDHIVKACAQNLPHVKYFDQAFAKGWTTPMEGPAGLIAFVDHILSLDAEVFASKEWRYSEWIKSRSTL